MRSTILAAAAAAIAFLSTPAHAQNTQTLTQFTRADLEQALTEAGATITPSETSAERIDFSFDDGVLAEGLLLACEDAEKKTGCLGSALLATFTPADGAKPEQIQEAINSYNYSENFGRAYLDEDGTISVSMYIIADGGITRENYSRQIGLWFNSVIDFFGYLYPE